MSMWSRPNLFMALSSSQPLDDCGASQSPRSLNPKSFRWEKYELHKWGESVDSGLGVYKKRKLFFFFLQKCKIHH